MKKSKLWIELEKELDEHKEDYVIDGKVDYDLFADTFRDNHPEYDVDEVDSIVELIMTEKVQK